MSYQEEVKYAAFLIEFIQVSSQNRPPELVEKLADAKLVNFASGAMLEKLEIARSKGRGGWWDKERCSVEHLRELLNGHIEKGDMRDVMNLAAMIYVRELADSFTEDNTGGNDSANVP